MMLIAVSGWEILASAESGVAASRFSDGLFMGSLAQPTLAAPPRKSKSPSAGADKEEASRRNVAGSEACSANAPPPPRTAWMFPPVVAIFAVAFVTSAAGLVAS
jgi:hypothetical protein